MMAGNGMHIVAYVRDNTIETHWLFKDRGDAETKFWYEAEHICGVDIHRQDFKDANNIFVVPYKKGVGQHDQVKLNLIYPD